MGFKHFFFFFLSEISGRSFQLDSRPARRELILPWSQRTRVGTLPPVLLGFPPSCRCWNALEGQRPLLPLQRCPLRWDFPSSLRFHSAFSWLPAGLLGGVACSRSRRPPLAVGQREGREGRAGSGLLGALWVCISALRSLLALCPASLNPLLPLSPLQKKGSSKRPRSHPPLFIFLISLFFPAPPFLPPKLEGKRPGRGDSGLGGAPGPGAAYQGVDAGAGSQVVGAGGAVAAAVGPDPREQAGAEGQQRAAESQEQRHGAARRRGQPAAASSRSHPGTAAPQPRRRRRRRERVQTNSAKLTLFRAGVIALAR